MEKANKEIMTTKELHKKLKEIRQQRPTQEQIDEFNKLIEKDIDAEQRKHFVVVTNHKQRSAARA